jgi:5-methylcytosine-specific restriction endonuclease McrA
MLEIRPIEPYQGLFPSLPKPRRKRRKESWHGSNWIRKARRMRIYARDGWRCVWCGCRVAIGAKARSQHLALAHLDHVRPRSLGGSNATENLITSCKRCNDRRGSMSAADFSVIMSAQESFSILYKVVKAIGKALP